MELGYQAVDADNHYYEAVHACTRHLDKEFRERGVQVVQQGTHTLLLAGGRKFRFIPNPTFDPIIVAGCMDLMFRGQIPEGVNVLPIQISLAAQIPQAVGLAWGLQLQQTGGVVVVYFGDGASSEGDFHEACNLAGVLKAPVVFMLSNNGWAISTPRHKQSRAKNLAARAPGYGFPGVVVDGNDVLGVHSVTSAAVARARAGDGPTLIEAITYRMGPHNTADDPTRYVSEGDLAAWRPLDPIERVQRYLAARGRWDDTIRARIEGELAREVDRALAVTRAAPAPNAAQIFEHVYVDPPATLCRQRGARLESLA